MFVIKFQHDDDIRRITVEQCLPIKDLIDLARSLFRENIPHNFALKYKDDEGDYVTITNDRELEEAFRLFKDSGILRLYIIKIEAPNVIPSVVPIPTGPIPTAPTPQQEKTSPLDNLVNTFAPYVEAMENEICDAWPKIEQQYKEIYPKIEQQCKEIYPKIAEQVKGFGETALDTLAQVFESNTKEGNPKEDVIHPAMCDNCQERIKGLRWKCLKCPDYDLCTTCKQKNVHAQPEHQFLKLERPLFKGSRGPPCQRPASAPPMNKPVKEAADIPLQMVEQPCSQPACHIPLEKKEEPVTPSEPFVTEEPKKVEEPKKEQPKISAFEAKLQQLDEMGFSDRPRNVQLLVKWNGDMVFVVRDLLDANM